MTNALIAKLKNLVAEFEGDASTIKTDVESSVSAGLTYFKSKVPSGAQVITAGEELLATMAAGTSWPDAAAALIAKVAQQGITLAVETATIALNYAQSNLIAQGKVTIPASGAGA